MFTLAGALANLSTLNHIRRKNEVISLFSNSDVYCIDDWLCINAPNAPNEARGQSTAASSFLQQKPHCIYAII